MEQTVPHYNSSLSSWQIVGKPDLASLINITAVVRVEDDRLNMLEDILLQVSDPDHENYGRYLNVSDVTKVLNVSEARVEKIRRYFLGHGAVRTDVHPNGDMIFLTMPVSAIEDSLNTELHIFQHKERSSVQIIRSRRGYSVPRHISEDVMMIGELVQFPRLRPRRLNNLTGTGRGTWPNDCASEARCQGLVTPGVLAKRYKLNKSSSNEKVQGNTMAVAEFQGQYFDPTDLKLFGDACNVPTTVDKVIGGNQPSAGVEAELDIEYIKAVAPGIELTVVYNNQYSLLNWAGEITKSDDSPLVHSVSYGNDEAQQTSVEYMISANTGFMKAGAMGRSILFASGDQGVCGREGCGGIFSKKSFKPDFPAASPYITAVGGTDFLGDAIGDETAWTFGGGGFSDTFGIPAYQKQAVEAYKAAADANLPPQALWNATGRGYPDVAALGGEKAPYCIATSGGFNGVSGTSASSPVVAGVFAILNGVRLKAGKKPLGFLNPLIYKNPNAFQDVSHGCNKADFQYGFNAVKGWDAATGHGTPDYEALLKVVESLP
eukprot:CAMPEP_0197522464 /NCGR_PEP_ID=MMETSP1318-20131121/7607_1 /TAXON_ID=552666 /ORGANISM="Partenskyella glossopodia, Strain RCC365" /LENGTH=546 /DNA_ID=CAMNT_0043074861 /DNA_START=153 /DNA_END=1793 /DNA_ORIENTATION=-